MVFFLFAWQAAVSRWRDRAPKRERRIVKYKESKKKKKARKIVGTHVSLFSEIFLRPKGSEASVQSASFVV